MLQKLQTKLSGPSASPEANSGPPAENKTLLEAFEWYSPADGQHWARLEQKLAALQSVGVTELWLPPGCKAGSAHSNGYDTYDLWDLGDFDQKGHVATKWGSKHDLVSLCREAQAKGMGLIWDAVLNHRAVGDYTHTLRAVEVSDTDRRQESGPAQDIEAWVGYDFPGRNGQYSDFKWNGAHFNGTDWDQRTQKRAIYKLLGAGEKDWAHDVDTENGNADYLLCHNVDLAREDVRSHYAQWARWIGAELGLTGLRYDAAKHMSRGFMKDHLERIDARGERREWLLIGEYCTGDVQALTRYVDEMHGRVQLFDFPLHQNMVDMARPDADLRRILHGSLVSLRPAHAITFVTNHDSQARDGSQELNEVAPHIIPIAYAMILLLANMDRPCVFWGDMYGVSGPEAAGRPPTCNGKLPRLVAARKLFAYGQERRYFDNRRCIGFTRAGHAARSAGAGLAVVANIGASKAQKRMQVGAQHAGETWTDTYGASGVEVVIARDGIGRFAVPPQGLAVYIDKTRLAELDSACR